MIKLAAGKINGSGTIALQAVQPDNSAVDDAGGIAVSGTANTTTNGVDGNAVYMYSTTPCHVCISSTGISATVNNPPIAANIPIVFVCSWLDKISVIKMAGQSDGTIWIHPVKEAQ